MEDSRECAQDGAALTEEPMEGESSYNPSVRVAISQPPGTYTGADVLDGTASGDDSMTSAPSHGSNDDDEPTRASTDQGTNMSRGDHAANPNSVANFQAFFQRLLDTQGNMDFFEMLTGAGRAGRVEEEGSGSEESDEDEDMAVEYDVQITGRHSYLGEGEERTGRTTYLSHGTRAELPLIRLYNHTLIPGEVAPLLMDGQTERKTVQHVLEGDYPTRTVGVVMVTRNRSMCSVGTTAEILSSPDTQDYVRVKGKQRFRLFKVHHVAGVPHGEVAALEDDPPLQIPRCISVRRITSSSKDGAIGRRYSSLAYHEYNTYRMYDAPTLVKRAKEGLTGVSIEGAPENPEDFSFWLARNLPLENAARLKLLELTSTPHRLRWELKFLNKFKIYNCRNCNQKLSSREEVFSMTAEGPAATHVNPHGVVHDFITVRTATNITRRGRPSTEFSWFPGYAWTILECSLCYSHVGWRFDAAQRHLRPKSFYAITRQSIARAMNVVEDDSEASSVVSSEGMDESGDEEGVAERQETGLDMVSMLRHAAGLFNRASADPSAEREDSERE